MGSQAQQMGTLMLGTGEWFNYQPPQQWAHFCAWESRSSDIKEEWILKYHKWIHCTYL